MGYRDYEVYKELEQLIRSAGVKIIYKDVPADRIDGTIWARTDPALEEIMMPAGEDFPGL